MKKLVPVGAAGALALGAVAAHASIALPSSGSSDAILFAEVVNAAGTVAVASYAGDTGISINQILSGLSGSTTVLGSDPNLSALFAADNTSAGDVLYFAVLGVQSNGGTANTKGNVQLLSTVPSNTTTTLAAATNVKLGQAYNGFNTDIGTINSNLSSPSASSVEGPVPANAGVWDYTNTAGTAYWDAASIANYNVGSATGSATADLYYVTGGGGTNLTKVSTPLEEATATLTSAGLTLTGTSSPVPLPAAVWLFGSGLLGLAGVARRKAKA